MSGVVFKNRYVSYLKCVILIEVNNTEEKNILFFVKSRDYKTASRIYATLSYDVDLKYTLANNL